MPNPHAMIVELYSHLTAACIAGLWQGAALGLIAAALMRLMPRASASLRHALLVVIFVMTALLPWFRFGAGSGSGHALRIAPWLAAAIAGAWLAFSCVRATGLFLAWRRLRVVRQQSIPVVLEGVEGFKVGDRRALLCLSADVDSPTIIGFREPRLLLPDWMAPLLTKENLIQIALHECEHLRRYDDWMNLLLQVGLVLSPLNLALVWLDRRIAMQRELACDAAVVASTAKPIAYATCLTRLAEQRMQHTRLALAMAAWGRRSELMQRVQALLTQPAAWTQRQSRLAACATAVALLAGAFGLARAPLFIRVAAAPQLAAIAAGATETDATIGDRIPQHIRAVPASFIVKPNMQTPAKHAKRRTVAGRRATFAPPSNWLQPARMVRTSADEAVHSRRRNADLRIYYEGPTIRFVTAEFSSPYIAVPVTNGWLVFQM
jgi:hypothetical protein